MRRDALGVLVGAQPLARREAEGERHAGGDRLAVQQPVGKAGLRLQRMAEGMAEVEQRALAAGLALILADDPRLGGDAGRDRLQAEVDITVEQRRAVRLAPG